MYLISMPCSAFCIQKYAEGMYPSPQLATSSSSILLVTPLRWAHTDVLSSQLSLVMVVLSEPKTEVGAGRKKSRAGCQQATLVGVGQGCNERKPGLCSYRKRRRAEERSRVRLKQE